jgi:1-acyl-sn-glycerol-3-phosphate acyltransferase
MNEFKAGITKILERTPVPVIPMALGGLWRSLFTRNRHKLRYGTKLFPRVRLGVGELVNPARATPEALHAAVLALRGRWK